MNGGALRDLASLAYHRTTSMLSGVTGRTGRSLEAQLGRAAILMYHRVIPDGMAARALEPGMYVRASLFQRHLEWIRSRWQVCTLGQLLDDPPQPTEPPRVVLTFDDGWRDNLTVAWPLLQRYDVRATIFVVKDWIAGADDAFMRPDELRALSEQGIEIGAHTVTHPRLDQLDQPSAQREMHDSKDAVERWTGRPCGVFAYPFGAHGTGSTELARGLFRASVTVTGGWWDPDNDPAQLPRIGIHQDMTSTRAMFEARLARFV